jgi:mono/diheme cytochrome c family protein
MPVWATAALAFLPLFGVMYMTTNDDPPVTTLGPLTTGATVFSTNCAGCHGATGGGGAGPALSGGAVLGTFADPADQVRWVLLGSANWDGGTYGDTKKALKGGMPGWATLTAGELLAVVRHERETLSGEEYDAEAWQAAVDKLKADANPTVAAAAEEYQAVIDEWATLPAGT